LFSEYIVEATWADRHDYQARDGDIVHEQDKQLHTEYARHVRLLFFSCEILLREKLRRIEGEAMVPGNFKSGYQHLAENN
jgi:hypothetical protein